MGFAGIIEVDFAKGGPRLDFIWPEIFLGNRTTRFCVSLKHEDFFRV